MAKDMHLSDADVRAIIERAKVRGAEYDSQKPYDRGYRAATRALLHDIEQTIKGQTEAQDG